jgi:hypothetical protein
MAPATLFGGGAFVRVSRNASSAGLDPAFSQLKLVAELISSGEFSPRGHEVRPMPPEYGGPYVKARKNDLDAEAIA